MKAKRIVIVDYGMGNIRSVCRAVERCGGEAVVSRDAATVTSADRLVLPGVGAFGNCMAALESHRLVEPILEFVASGRPLLGICVGMQVLHDFGEEFGGSPGLGLIPGRVSMIPTTAPDGAVRKIPHIGWSRIAQPERASGRWSGTLLEGLDPRLSYYFVHSFSVSTTDAKDTLAIADYEGFAVTAAVQHANITGMQFHPEKSGNAGLGILTRFLMQV